MNETLKRSLTGIIFVALIVFSLILGPLFYGIVFLIACTTAWIEASRLFPATSRWILPAGALFVAASYALVYFYARGFLNARWLIALPAALLIMLIPDRFTHRSTEGRFLAFLLLIWISAGFGSVHLLAWLPWKNDAYSPRWVLYTLYFLWMNDTLAYVTGRLFGKHPIWPRASPSKTWEGTLGGALFTLALAYVFSRMNVQLSSREWFLFAFVVILSGILGDLLESLVKRRAGVKDSGRLLPGHGGLLDRFDSFLLAVPSATIFLYFAL